MNNMGIIERHVISTVTASRRTGSRLFSPSFKSLLGPFESASHQTHVSARRFVYGSSEVFVGRLR